ncbi:MAG: hypothetical protein ABFS09_08675 [Thermodesulfobacteriota bacterium]
MKLKSSSLLLALLISFFLVTGCRQSVQLSLPLSKSYFTKANIWYQQPKIWSSNFKAGSILPAGTKISSLTLHKGRYHAIEFTTADNKTYWLYLAPKFDPGLSLEELQQRLFGSKNFSELTRGLSSAEVTAIKQGQVAKGMSKAAVLVSWGYPPTALTPSPKAHKWTFWKSRFDKQNIFFDSKGRVADIVD